MVNARAILATNRTSTRTITRGFTFRERTSSFSYAPAMAPKTLLSFCPFACPSIFEDMAGTTVRAMTRLASRE